jgi:transposase
MTKKKTDLATRALIVTLKAPCAGKSTAEISAITGISTRTINSIYARAIERGFEPNSVPLVIRDEWLQDASRSGRPTKKTEIKEEVISKVRRDRYGREKTCTDIAGELTSSGFNVSSITVWRVLREAGFRKTKPTRKPGLTKKMKTERLDWCLAYRHWTLEDWKNVIWSDETSVILLHRRGSYRVWRKSDEALVRSCIRERWKGASEFMFWGSFSYDKKGPCYCWGPETTAEKNASLEIIEKLNEELEPKMKEQWELSNGMRRLNLRQLPGPKPVWRWNKKNGKLARSLKGGIDWYRYHYTILIPKLLPFAKECERDRPNTIVQEDKAPAHDHHYQQHIFDLQKVQRLLWCGNSPDLNMIEPAWPWMKRRTTRKGAPKSRQEAIRAWKVAWDELPQEAIHKWIERIPHHIEQIIALGGGNEYKEGRDKSLLD